MSNLKEPNGLSLNQIPKMLGEIGGFVTAILAYLLAIVGYAPSPFSAYSSTISILTILVTLVVLWLWRWAKITKKKSTEIAALEEKREASLTDTLLGPFRSSHSWLFSMSLPRRRFEIICLSSLTLLTVSITGLKIPLVIEEISGLHCLNKISNAPRIIIANFSASNPSPFDNNLAIAMEMQVKDQLQICRYNRPVEFPDEAKKIGDQSQAMLVIWGNTSEEVVKVYWKAVNWEMLDERTEISLGQGQDEDDIALFIQMIGTEILFNQDQVAEAQKNIGAAVEAAEAVEADESRALARTNPKLLASGYFLQGLLFDPNQLTKALQAADTPKAIRAYSQAIELDPDLDTAHQNRSLLYWMKQHDPEKAKNDCEALISKHSETYYIDACLICGQIYLEQKNYGQAIAKFEIALQDASVDEAHPDYPYLVHYLGQAYLLHGEALLAEQTYQRLHTLNPEDAEVFINDLTEIQNAPELPPDTQAIIKRIIAQIQHLPAH